MLRSIATFLAVVALLVLMAAPAFAIVHPVTPIGCNGAVAASGGSAGGVAAFPVLANPDNPAPGPPMPAQGLANSSACD